MSPDPASNLLQQCTPLNSPREKSNCVEPTAKIGEMNASVLPYFCELNTDQMKSRQVEIDEMVIKARQNLDFEIGQNAASKITDAQIIGKDAVFGFEHGIGVSLL